MSQRAIRGAWAGRIGIALGLGIALGTGGIGGSLVQAQVGPAGDPPAKKPAPLVTTLPKVPEPVLDALQDRKFDEAVRLIDIALQGKDVVAPDYLRYLKARALAEGEKSEAALAAYEEVSTMHPQSDWASRARFGRAEVFTKQRNYRAAAEVYQSESQRLLSTGRRDKLAAIYLEFADKWFEGVPSADPAGTKQKDFAQAAAYYEQALKLEPSRAVRQRVELRIADCHLELKQYDKALAAYKTYVEKYAGAKTKAEDRVSADVEMQAKYRLGRTQLESGQRVEARRTWTDLLASAAAKSVQESAAKDGAGAKPAGDAKSESAGEESAVERIARAAFGLGHTYGLPEPGSDADLEHGIAAHERFLKAYPQHKLAAEADFEVAQALLWRGRNDRAVARLKALIADPARAETPQVALARRRLGDAFLAQQKYAEAIAAWREFLDRHPTNPQWSAVQQSIVDTEYAVAEKQRGDDDFAAARKSWETFLNKYPLDPRAPRILFEFGRMKHDAAAKQDKDERKAAAGAKPAGGAVAAAGPHAPSEAVRKLFEEALADWQRLGQKYPQSAEASEAAYMGAVVLETRLGRLAEALDAYRKVTGSYQSAAQRRIGELTANRLEVATERKFRTNEPARIRLTTRNLEKVTVKVYRVDPEAYFRKMHEAGGVEALDVALIDPDKTWEHPVAGFEKYRSIEGDIPIPTDGPATIAVTVSSDKLEATTLLVVGDVDVVVKSSRNELFVFAENLRTQKPVPGAVVLVSDGKKVFAEEKTGADGVVQKSYEELKACGDLRVFCLSEGHAASTVADLEGLDFAVGLAPVGRIATDRPAYRAGQVVNVRGIVRRVAADRFEFKEGETYRFDAYDPRGRLIHSSEVKLGRFGTFAAHFVLPDSVPQGSCRLHLHRPDGTLSFDAAFQVHEYSLDPVWLSVDLPRQVWFRGETVTATIGLKYHYGAPLAGRTVTWSFGDEGEQTGTTDGKGQIAVEFPTQQYDESRTLTLSVRHAERNLTAQESVFLATQGFDVAVTTRRKVYLAGETFDATVGLVDPAGKPVAADVSLEVVRIDSANGRTGETVLETHPLKTEAEKGEATKTVKIEKAGRYVLRATGTDRFGNRISGAGSVTISGDDDRIRLRILADQHRWKTGDVAQVRLHWRDAPALALVTYEGARILGHRTLELKTGINVLEVPLLSSFAPNFDLAVAVMETGKFHQARSEFRVAQRMRIDLKPDKTTLRPGEDLTVEVTTTDAQGKPVSAEVSLGLVQKSLLERFGAETALESLFTGDLRVVSVRGTSSATFAYRPTTRGISEFLLAEEERKAAETREETSRARIRDQRRIVGRGRDPMAPPNAGPGRGEVMEQAAQMALEASEQLMELNEEEDGNFAEVAEATVRPNDDDSLSVAVDAVWAFDGLARQTGDQQSLNQSLERLGTSGELRKSLQSFGRPTPGEGFGARHDRPLSDTKGFLAGGMAANGDLDKADDGKSGGTNRAAWGRLPDASRLALVLQRGVQLSQVQFEAGRWKEQLAGEKENVYAVDRSGALQVVNGLPAPRIAVLAAEGLRLLPGTAASETAYWNPAVVSDAQGKARVVFRLPERSTAWTLRAQGIDADVLAGQADAGIVTRKELFGEIKLPPAFTVGDVARIPVEVHDSVVEKGQKIAVRLETKTGEKTVAVDRSFESQGPGIVELEFPVEIVAGEKIEFALTVSSGKFTDLVRTEVPIRPLGLTVFATQSGTAAQSNVVLVDPDPNVSTAGRTLEILIGPTVDRALLDAVLGSGSMSCDADLPGSGPERAVSDVLGGVALLKMLGQSRETGTPEAQALTGRIASAVSALVSSQREDGTWNWAGRADSDRPDRHLTSRVAWALASARRAGFAVPAPTFDKTVQALRTAFAASALQDREGQAILLHGLTEAGAGDFAFANRLHRDRNLLSPSGLLHLAIVFVRLDRPEMAKDLLALVKLPVDGALPAAGGAVPGEAKPAEIRTIPWMQGAVELRALWMIALSETEPTSPKLAALADSLLAARRGGRWLPEKANGPALVALGNWFGRTKFASEKYVLSVFANEKLVERLEVDPSVDPSRRLLVPARMLVEGRQKIHFDLEGRGRFSWSVVLGGFVPADKLKSTTTDWTVKRTWEPAQRLLDGQPVPRGFGIVAGAVTSWQNPLTQLPAGERGEVSLEVARVRLTGQPDEAFDYLVLTDPLPAGATVLEDTIKGSFDRYEVGAGAIVFYLGDRPAPGTIRYSVAGTLPGSYKAGPSVARSFYRPERIAVADPRPLTVLARGEKSADAYKLTPVELFELGKRLYAKGDRAAAGKHLDELFRNFRLRDDVYRQTVEMLFRTALAEGAPPRIVEFFEIIKEKYPDVEIDFAAISKVGDAYLSLGEYERCFLVFRATVEAGFERETQIAGFLDGRGEFLRSVGVMESLLREYPAEPWTASATYALAQEVYGKAPGAVHDARLKEAGVTRVDLLAAVIRMLDHFVAVWPRDPAADQASFSLANALLDLDRFDEAVERCERFAARYPQSSLLDSFWYVIGYGQFALGRHDDALKTCLKVADFKRRDPSSGTEVAALNREQALYIRGQVFHSLGRPAEAVAEYGKVRTDFADAAEAIEFFTRKEIAVPEVSTFDPAQPAKLELKFRNVPEAGVKVYRIDLLKFGLLQRNLDRITSINLAGIRPYHEQTVALGDGKDYRDKTHALTLPLKEEGAYLVVCRAENLYSSGLVLVSPLRLQLQEDAESGRVRTTVRDVVGDKYVHDVLVKVIGSADGDFRTGRTDLRGIFTADDVHGTTTVIARASDHRYAFHRGKTWLGPKAQPQTSAPAAKDGEKKPAADGKDALLKNLRQSNESLQQEQRGNYRGLLENKKGGVKANLAR